MQIRASIILLIRAHFYYTIATAQPNPEMDYEHYSNPFLLNWKLPSSSGEEQQPPAPSTSLDVLNPLFAQFYTATSAGSSDQKYPPRVPSPSDVGHHQMSTSHHFHNLSVSGVETHEHPIISNTSAYNGDHHQTNDSSSATSWEYLPTITTPFLDYIANGFLGGLQQHVQLIKPGTKWCGDGNKARNYEDVGVLYKTDKCCRMHDKCPHYILARENKYGLYNDAPFTRSHCDCDASFYDCLKKVNSPFSTGVGITYFNILKMKCFRLEYPVVMCSRMAGWLSKHCIEYIVDMAKSKNWQWFDNHEF